MHGKFGNWIVTLGAQERWWGSGYEGGLMLSSNARPVPAVALDRAVSEAVQVEMAQLDRSWRLTTFMGPDQEGDREDYAPHPLLFGFRVSAGPLDGLEVSLERTAQWCGEGRSCNWNDFWNLWSGHDNAGERCLGRGRAGNQLAGWDIRWASPIGDWPYALYNQHTGESIDSKIPRPYHAAWTSSASRRGVPSEASGAAAAPGSVGEHEVRGHAERTEALGLCLQQRDLQPGRLSLSRSTARSLDGW